MKKTLVRYLSLITAVCFICVSMSGCCIQHKWVKATCTRPKHCSECNKTEGKALGHKWKEATCEHPEKCSRCGSERGKPKGHIPADEYSIKTLNDGSQVRVKYCTICGNEVSRESIGIGNGLTISDFIDAFNSTADNINASGKLGSAKIDRLNYDDMSVKGKFLVNQEFEITVNWATEEGYDKYDRCKSANLDVDDFTLFTDDVTVAIFLCYIGAMNKDFLEENTRKELAKYFFSSPSDNPTPPDIDGYYFEQYNLDNSLGFFILEE